MHIFKSLTQKTPVVKEDYFLRFKQAFETGILTKVGIHILKLSQQDICNLEKLSETLLTKKFNQTEINQKVSKVETSNRFYLEAVRIFGIPLTKDYAGNTANPDFRKEVDNYLRKIVESEFIYNFIQTYINQDGDLLNSGIQSVIEFFNECKLTTRKTLRKIEVANIGNNQWQILDYATIPNFIDSNNPENKFQDPLNEQPSVVFNNIYTLTLEKGEISIEQKCDVYLNDTADKNVLKKILENLYVNRENPKAQEFAQRCSSALVLETLQQNYNPPISTNSYVINSAKELRNLKILYLKNLMSNKDLTKNLVSFIDQLPWRFIDIIIMLLNNSESLKKIELEIPNNKFKDAAIALANLALIENKKLETLQINCPNLKFYDLILLLTFLKSNKTLKILDLSANVIEQKNIKALVELINKSTCEKVIINKNNLDEKAMPYIIDNLQVTTKIAFVASKEEGYELINPLDFAANDESYSPSSRN